MSTVTVKEMSVLALYVTDLDRAKAFYVGHLGFQEGERTPPGVLLRSGNVTLYLEGGRAKRKTGAREVSEFSPCFATDSIKQSYEALKSAGVDVVEKYKEYGPQFALFKVADPDGNLVEFAGEP